MINQEIAFWEYEAFEYGDSKIMNRDIAQSKEKFVAFLDKSAASGQEIAQLLDEYEFLSEADVCLFGDGVPEGEAGILDMLPAFDMDIMGFVVKREVFEETGCFNEKLGAGADYEFLCRAAACRTIYCVPCKREGEQPVKRQISAEVLAYVLRRYMVCLREHGSLEAVLGAMEGYAARTGMSERFLECLNRFLDGSEYDVIAENTAPFFVISGDDTCYGVLKEFAASLADALAGLGQAVITTDHRHGKFREFDELEKMQFKGIIGFQAPVLEKEFFRNIRGRKLQFWFDNPAFFNEMFRNLTDDYYVLCQDAYYAQHLRQFYQVKNALQFPPAGRECGCLEDVEKCYDLVFVGTYQKPDLNCIKDSLQLEYFEYIMAHPQVTFEEGLREVFRQKGLKLEQDKFLLVLWSLVQVNRLIINSYRKAVIERIISAGFTIHVFGDSWNSFEPDYVKNLVIHPAVSGREALRILAQAKISLNVMTWHKAGMTERIANSMLAGAVCLSDETVYLKEHFAEDEEIVLYSLDKLEELPGKIARLLENEAYRRQIAQKAYEKAAEEHTWERRARQLLDLLD